MKIVVQTFQKLYSSLTRQSQEKAYLSVDLTTEAVLLAISWFGGYHCVILLVDI